MDRETAVKLWREIGSGMPGGGATGRLRRHDGDDRLGCERPGRIGGTVDLNTLQPKALAAAMKGGTAGWGQVASAAEHVRYAQPVRAASRRRCCCGCNQRATHLGMANGCGLATGCELGIQRWVRTGRVRAT